jgi:hypothetical protein
MACFPYRIHTTANGQSLISGAPLDLEHRLNADHVRERVVLLLRSRPEVTLPADVELLIYLPGGCPSSAAC